MLNFLKRNLYIVHVNISAINFVMSKVSAHFVFLSLSPFTKKFLDIEPFPCQPLLSSVIPKKYFPL